MNILLGSLVLSTLVFLPNVLRAENVSYLLQSITDINKVELLTDQTKINILYINPKCSSCFQNADLLMKKNNSKFIIVVGQKPINKLIQTLEILKVPKRLWSSIYLDPGLRFVNSNKISNKTAVLIAYRNGKVKMTPDVFLSVQQPSPKELSIWKTP